ncbi:MAG: PAS domain-containing sensor histidine kinase [bacterium]|nr:MAG: PAS domain-containing sensor histidine kinase [bacterium]
MNRLLRAVGSLFSYLVRRSGLASFWRAAPPIFLRAGTALYTKFKLGINRFGTLVLSFFTPASEEDPDNPGYARNRWKKILIFGAIIFFLIVSTTQLLFQGPRANIPIANNLLILFLLNINILLLMVMVVLVGRNLVKLYMERHGRVFGSRFQTRLILSFVMLTLIPSVLLFIVASGLITNSVDNWFSETVENSLKDSLEVAEKLYQQSEQAVSEKADRIAELIKEKRMLEPENSIYLKNTLKRYMRRSGVETGVVFDTNFNEIVHIGEKLKDAGLPQSFDDELIKRLESGEIISETQMLGRNSLVVSLAPITTMSGRFSGALLLVDSIDRSLVEKVNAITTTFDEYKQLKLQRFPIKAVYEVTLLLMTLIILFAAIWYGFYLAKDITVPINELAEATQKVTEGDLTVRLVERSDNEIGFLIRSFNRMTEELGTSRFRLESSHTELVKINLELDQRRKYIETILAKIATGVISIDNRGRITTCNPAANSILKIKDPEPLGKYYEDVFDPVQLEPIRQMLREMGRKEKDSIETETHLSIDGVQLTLIVHTSTLMDAGRHFLGVVVVFDDLTNVINAQKTSAWREIAQHIAHEIKNPLTPIRLNTERLRRMYLQDKATFRKIFDNSTGIIIEEVEVLKNLVDEFSRFGQLPEAKPTQVSLHTIINDVVNLYRGSKPDVLITTSFDPSIGLVRLDKEQMHRAFRNLVENAVDAVGTQGAITIRTSHDDSGKRVLIEIIDDGPGIDVKNHDKIFLPYFSTKKKGTGLGLAIVNRIVADHEGQIRVKNRSPHGTVMAMELPAA